MAEEQLPNKYSHRYRADTDLVLNQGIYHADILDKGGIKRDISVVEEFPSRFPRGEEAASATESKIKEAEALFFQRYKALFFWPAVMSTIK